MMLDIQYVKRETDLDASTFLDLVNLVWPGIYDIEKTKASLNNTINITAWQDNRLVGSVRVLSDGYFFSTITEILVDPEFQKQGIGTKLMEMAWNISPSSLSFGSQPGNEAFFEKLGFEKGLISYQKKKR